jgi:hypothetical protein
METVKNKSRIIEEMKETLEGLNKSGIISERSLKKLNVNLLTHKQMISEMLKNPGVRAELKRIENVLFLKV